MAFKDVNKSGDRGPREFKSHIVEKEGNIMDIANKEVISAFATTPVIKIAELMEEHDFRRIPIINPGTKRIVGVARAIDIIDFFGGGEKYNIVLNDYRGNLLAAVNCPISKIMKHNFAFLNKGDSIDKAVDIILNQRTSLIPVLDKEGHIAGVVTERDIMPVFKNAGIKVQDVMCKKVITSSEGMMISDAARIMVKNGIRRLPVIKSDKIIGIITVFDVIGFFRDAYLTEASAENIIKERVDGTIEKEIVSVSPDMDLADVIELIDTTGFGGFPVVEDGTLSGIITTSDIIRGIYR